MPVAALVSKRLLLSDEEIALIEETRKTKALIDQGWNAGINRAADEVSRRLNEDHQFSIAELKSAILYLLRA